MWDKLNKKEKGRYLNKWIASTLKDETDKSLKNHIVKHAKEIYKKDPMEWLASMKNLVEAYELMNGIKPDLELRLKKLADKYLKNPKRYTPPPKI